MNICEPCKNYFSICYSLIDVIAKALWLRKLEVLQAHLSDEDLKTWGDKMWDPNCLLFREMLGVMSSFLIVGLMTGLFHPHLHIWMWYFVLFFPFA